MNYKKYSGEVIVKFIAYDIECDGTLDDFLAQVVPEGWDGEADVISGNIHLEEDEVE